MHIAWWIFTNETLTGASKLPVVLIHCQISDFWLYAKGTICHLLSCVYLFFSFIFISWRLITLQYCSGFCHTLTWISHGFTCIPHVFIFLDSIYLWASSMFLQAAVHFHQASFTTTRLCHNLGFPGGLVVKNLPAKAGGAGDMGLISGLGRVSGGGHGNPLQ